MSLIRNLELCILKSSCPTSSFTILQQRWWLEFKWTKIGQNWKMTTLILTVNISIAADKPVRAESWHRVWWWNYFESIRRSQRSSDRANEFWRRRHAQWEQKTVDLHCHRKFNQLTPPSFDKKLNYSMKTNKLPQHGGIHTYQSNFATSYGPNNGTTRQTSEPGPVDGHSRHSLATSSQKRT